MKTTGNTENSERGLLPYPVIIAATTGDPDAMKIFCSVTRDTYPSCLCENSATSAAIPTMA